MSGDEKFFANLPNELEYLQIVISELTEEKLIEYTNNLPSSLKILNIVAQFNDFNLDKKMIKRIIKIPYECIINVYFYNDVF